MGGFPTTEHTYKQFDAELESIRSQVLQMGGLVESQIQRALEGFTEGKPDLLDEVIADDAKVNALEVAIDEDCALIIARRQPAAIDLRIVMTVIKTITDLERIGDEAEKIARNAKLFLESGKVKTIRLAEIRHAADLATDMLRDALDAFARLDVLAALEVVKQDERVDVEFRSILRQLITFMMEDPRTISTSLEILFIAKAIERIGDHAKNMAEYVIYLVKGKDVRHVSIEEIEREAMKP
jgi:phosphate transport system protein